MVRIARRLGKTRGGGDEGLGWREEEEEQAHEQATARRLERHVAVHPGGDAGLAPRHEEFASAGEERLGGRPQERRLARRAEPEAPGNRARGAREEAPPEEACREE